MRRPRVDYNELQTGRRRHTIVWRHGAFLFLGNMTQGALSCCTYEGLMHSFIVCENTEQQAQQVAGNPHGEDFPSKTPWRTPIKIHRERRRKRRQHDLQEWHRLAQRRKRRQHSDHKHVQRQRQTTITLQTKLVKRENTDCQRFKNQWGDQSTLEVYSQNDLLRCRSYTICTKHAKNIFPTDWRQPISL